MKIGASYNLWKGEEFLPYSIKSIRNYVDYIVVVYQTTSNYKQERKDLTPLLDEWVELGLIDEWVFYEPEFDGIDRKWWGTHNELIKRNIGLNKCLKNNCSYLVDLDGDEIYEPSQFWNAVKEIFLGKYDSGFVLNTTYYKYPDCEITPPETKYTPFIYKIKEGSKFEPIENDEFPVIVDGKRRIRCGYSKIFTRDEIVLHHYSYVRSNEQELIDKFNNCSSNMNFSKERIARIIDIYKNFEVGNQVEYGLDEVYMTKKVNNLFNIKL
jgi:hypothetical protein